MTCDTVNETLNALADGELSPFAARRVRRHLSRCPACAAAFAAAQTLTTRARALPEHPAPPNLEARIAAALPPPLPRKPTPKLRWQPALAAALTVAALAAALLLPGSPTRPLPAFADVEKAMANVKYVSFRKSFSVQMAGGKWWNREERIWIRRNPPAIATRIESGEKPTTQQTLLDGQRRITYNARTGKWDMAKSRFDIQSMVARDIRSLTELPTDANSSLKSDPWAVHAKATPWCRRETTLDGKSVLRFDREVATPGHEVRGSSTQKPIVIPEQRSASTIWVDAQTLRVVKREMTGTRQGQIISRSTLFNFHYDEPPPAGVFDWSPPKGAKVTVSGTPQKK